MNQYEERKICIHGIPKWECKECVNNYRRKQMREFYYKNRERILRKNRKWRRENKDKVREINRKYRLKLKLEIEQIFGKSCKICGEKKTRMIIHEIHGKDHNYGKKYILEHSEDFILLCYSCHLLIHILAEVFDKIEICIKFAKLIRGR